MSMWEELKRLYAFFYFFYAFILVLCRALWEESG